MQTLVGLSFIASRIECSCSQFYTKLNFQSVNLQSMLFPLLVLNPCLISEESLMYIKLIK